MTNDSAIGWLLEDNNPAIKYSTMTELLRVPKEKKEVVNAKGKVVSTLSQAVDTQWVSDVRGLWLTSNLVALAECGLDKSEIDERTKLLSDGHCYCFVVWGRSKGRQLFRK